MSLDPQQLEFLLSQIHDGTLSAEQRAAVEHALASDETLQQLAARYERLGTLIAQIRSSRIAVNATALTEAIRDAIANDLRFQMSQDIDDQLSPVESARLSQVLAGNLSHQREDQGLREVQSLLDRYAAARPVPSFSDLSSRIGAAVRR